MDVPKKRGRKPKLPKEDPQDGEEIRKRKRGRKPKCEITSIHDIREKFKDSDDKVIFHGSSEPIETNLEQVQVPFGNLNITVHTAPKTVDKDELRNMYTKQTFAPPAQNQSTLTQTTQKQVQVIQKQATQEYFESDESESEECYDEQKVHEVYSDSETPKEAPKKSRTKIHKLLYHISEFIRSNKEWPQTCDTLCWWCCHPFDGIPIPCVSKYDSVKKRFRVYGIFCSWECSAAFGLSENNSLLNLILLKRQWTGDSSDIKKAPSRYLLRPFGGFMSIEEFRGPKTNKKYHVSTSTLDFVNQNCIETYETNTRESEVRVKCKPVPRKTSFFGNLG
jgi:hypothetical protein